MSQILVRQGARCQEHPHRLADQKCDRCGQPFCVECLSPSERLADGTRKWFCPKCVWLIREETEREARERDVRYRLERAARRTRIALTAGIATAAVIAVSTAGYFVFARTFGKSAPAQAIAERAGSCGELTRIRSIGSIGTQGPEDAVNVLAYPSRAEIRLLPVGGAAPPALPEPAAINGLVDECNTGWRAAPAADGIQLPLALSMDVKREAVYVQRFALWQDPEAPHASWVRDFELLASPSETGDDFQPVPLDRDGQLRESTEAQWFEIQRPGPGGSKFPDAMPIRRLQVRVLNTWGAPRVRPKVDQLSLGEVAAYGPDLEIAVVDTEDGNYGFKPNVIRALAQQPKFVMLLNTSRSTHRLASAGQQQNFDVTLEPGQVKSIQFIAGRPGRFEFVCKIAGHDFRGLIGSIQVR